MCSCDDRVTVAAVPLFDRDEMLASAWLEHRRTTGATRDIGHAGRWSLRSNTIRAAEMQP